MLARKLMKAGAGGFADPRAEKTNILNHTTALSLSLTSCTRGAAIVGPDGVTLDAYRITASSANSYAYWAPSQIDRLVSGQRYTASMYVRSSAGARMGLGNGSADGLTPIFYNGLPVIPNFTGWALYESEQVANSNIEVNQWYYWIGLNNSFSTNEWIEIARPMVYAGTKVT